MDIILDANNIIRMAQNSKDVLIELYAKQRNMILKIIGGVVGLATFFSYLKNLDVSKK